MGFFNLYQHHFARVAAAIPDVRVADPSFNAARTVALMGLAAERHVALTVFPELGLSSYSNEDLIHQDALLDASLEALATVVQESSSVPGVFVVGLPLRVDGLLYNVAATVSQGRVLGITPKQYLPNYREFYELRQWTPGITATATSIDLAVTGQRDVPFGWQLIYQWDEQPLLRMHVEICEDLWTPIPPSSYASLAGATVLVNLSASNALVGKADYRRSLGANQSARCLAAYVFSAAGYGESTTDLAWDAHGFVYENGTLLAESERFRRRAQLVTADVDLDRLVQERMRQNSFGESVRRHREAVAGFRTVRFSTPVPGADQLPLERRYERFPYVPSDPASRDARCREVYEIQVHGLVKRLESMRAEKVVIGISGGLDSTQALIVCARAMDVMGLPRTNILGFTMPGFATSERTLDQARRLMAGVGCTAAEIDVRPSCRQMLADIGHPYANGEPVYDVTFENVQAGERTSHLFRLANLHDAPVVGTGDLSELALGWCTYGVGDHMSHYNVNASVPKTLIQHLIRYEAGAGELGADTSEVLLDVLETEISPELIPGGAHTGSRQPAQSTEATIGPYELQDFHLYYVLRFGYLPTKVAFLSWSAWHEKYPLAEVRQWLGVFITRFFQTSQYKRSAVPNGPKVGSGGSLSPRGDWRAPSDADATTWLANWEQIPSD